MRPSGSESDARRPSPADRDELLERNWIYEDREVGLSTLAFVSAYRDKLAREYLDWRADYPMTQNIREDLPTWERVRFGSQLDSAAHGMLLFGVLATAYPDDARFAGLRKRETTEIAGPQDMPEARQSRRERDAALARLRAQAVELQPEAGSGE